MATRRIQISLLTTVILMLVAGAALPLFVRLFRLSEAGMLPGSSALLVSAFIVLFGLMISGNWPWCSISGSIDKVVIASPLCLKRVISYATLFRRSNFQISSTLAVNKIQLPGNASTPSACSG